MNAKCNFCDAILAPTKVEYIGKIIKYTYICPYCHNVFTVLDEDPKDFEEDK